MCGIFGLALKSEAHISKTELKKLISELYLLSERRGKESAGLHVYLPKEAKAWTLKGAQPASILMKRPQFEQVISELIGLIYIDQTDRINQPLIIAAHSRLVTNGSAALAHNNQPVRWGGVSLIHNGIIVNVDSLWQEHAHLTRHAEVDTEVMAALIADNLTHNNDTVSATCNAFNKIKGAASIAWTHEETGILTLATNTGDLYYSELPSAGIVFASEHYILEKSIISACNTIQAQQLEIIALKPQSGICVDFESNTFIQAFDMHTHEPSVIANALKKYSKAEHNDIIVDEPKPFTLVVKNADESLIRYNEKAIRNLKRCTCCILPETFPFIHFDEQGVCNYCKNYQPKYKGLDPNTAKHDFLQQIDKYRSQNGTPDVLVPFSGGRDSCYGLHLIKQEFGFNPITFTYDWGMVTDLARRNIARLCGQLGVQNILVSADIKTKRDNIRKNVSAWLKQPDLGMVPLFMAGDKHFFKIVNELKRQTGIRLDLWSANPLENTDFKSGFCGVSPDFDKTRVDYLSKTRKVQLASYYLKCFVTNPSYLNTSLLDTMVAFFSYYIEPRRDFFFMFNHLIWNEDEVNRTLLSDYEFELSPDSPSTWRIGDGTAPFYNYIYLTARGFTEFDTFRSNQIREGQISRMEALNAIEKENYPRIASLRWYLEAIDLDFNETIKVINKLDINHLHEKY